MRLQLPSLQALKLAQLKHIAIQCGIGSSGTKAVLTSRIEEELVGVLRKTEAGRPRHGEGNKNTTTRGGKGIDGGGEGQQQQRILSIDMGIRNLAYCIFDKAAQTSPTVGKPLPIRAWKCISVSARPTKKQPASSSSLPTTPTTTTKESFEPSTYAHHAYTFLSSLIRTHAPTQILIERQRYRSMGSSAVQEWTVRVNMFEGMLYAVLRTLVEEGRWSGTVHGVSPLKVSSFWLIGNEGDNNEKKKKAKTARARNKAAKVDLVASWLEERRKKNAVGVVECGTEEAKRAAHVYLERWRGKGRGGRRKKEEEEDVGKEEGVTKLDDQADCLLQGVAWLRWEENKLRVLRDGVEALNDGGGAEPGR